MTARRLVLAVALAQLVGHVWIAVVVAQTYEQMRIERVEARQDRLEDRQRSTERDVGILQSEMSEVRWLVRGTTAAIIGQLIAGFIGYRERNGRSSA